MNNEIILQFSSVDKPYVLIKIYDDSNNPKMGFAQIKKENMKDDLPIYDELLVVINQFLNDKNSKRDNIHVILNCSETKKLVTIIPNLGNKKSKKIYETSISNNYQDIDKYDKNHVESYSDNNIVFYDYITDKRYKEFFVKLVKELGFKNIKEDHLYQYLYKRIIKNHANESFAYICEEKGIATLIVCVDGKLCGYNSFEATEEKYRLNVSSIIDNHIQNIEKADITKVYSNKFIPCLKELNLIIEK